MWTEMLAAAVGAWVGLSLGQQLVAFGERRERRRAQVVTAETENGVYRTGYRDGREDAAALIAASARTQQPHSAVQVALDRVAREVHTNG